MDSYAFDVLVVPTCRAVLAGLIYGTLLLRLIVGLDHLLGWAWADPSPNPERSEGEPPR